MQAYYPRFVKGPIPGNPDREAKVMDAVEHERRFPEDFARFQAELALDPTQGRGAFSASVSAAEERERSAIVAESFPKAGKLGSQIAAAIRGQIDEALRFPKVLRNPEIGKGGKFTVPGSTPEAFTQPDVTVNDAAQEAAARADGFTILISENPLPGSLPVEATPIPQLFPKVLRNPDSKPMPDTKYTEARDGRFQRPDVTVQNQAEELAARADGFTILVPKPPKP
jgi:hypothetical protein